MMIDIVDKDYQLTSALPSFLGDFTQNKGVGHNDDSQGDHIHSHHIEQVVRQLMVLGGEKVECHTLCEPFKVWVALYMEYHALKAEKDEYVQFMCKLCVFY